MTCRWTLTIWSLFPRVMEAHEALSQLKNKLLWGEFTCSLCFFVEKVSIGSGSVDKEIEQSVPPFPRLPAPWVGFSSRVKCIYSPHIWVVLFYTLWALHFWSGSILVAPQNLCHVSLWWCSWSGPLACCPSRQHILLCQWSPTCCLLSSCASEGSSETWGLFGHFFLLVLLCQSFWYLSPPVSWLGYYWRKSCPCRLHSCSCT